MTDTPRGRRIDVFMTGLRRCQSGFVAELCSFKSQRFYVRLTREELLDHAAFVRVVREQTQRWFFFVTTDDNERWLNYLRFRFHIEPSRNEGKVE